MNTDRLLGILILLTVLILGIIGRLFYIQIYLHDEYLYKAQRQQIGTETIKANRGLIYDRNMVVLAFSDPEMSFFAAMKQIKKYKNEKNQGADYLMRKIARSFSAITKKDTMVYLNLMKSGENRVLLETTSDTTALKLKLIKLDGVYCEETPKRYYPYNSVASHLIGFIDKKDFEGKDGIEKTFEQELQGKDGVRTILRDPNGHMISVLEEATAQPAPGNNVVLTIDKHIETFLEEELAKGLESSKAEYASGIIMDPQTGEIIALANERSYDLNKYNNYSDSTRRNHIISDSYEPGSTLKGISLAGFLERSLCKETEQIDVQNGKLNLYGAKIEDTHAGNILSVREVFTKSSNVGMAKLAQRIDKEEFYRYLRSFGFGTVTNISLPAEAKGNLRKPAAWWGSTQLTLGYGYGVQVSALQLITAYAAIINGGALLQPQIVKRIESPVGKIVSETKRTEIRKVISWNTSRRMVDLLKAVVEEGTGKKAKIQGISVGGKTGTACIFEDGKYTSKYNASFVGFFPVENPRYLCLILVHKPSGGSYYGGDVAAPVFKNVAERIIQYDPSLRVKKYDESQKITKQFATGNSTSGKVDSVKNKVTMQTARHKVDNKNVMPDVRGLSLRDAIAVLSQLKLSYTITGSQRVIYQSISPGSRITPGMKCEIRGVELKQALAVSH